MIWQRHSDQGDVGMKKVFLCILALFLIKGNSIILLAEEVPGMGLFPASPPPGITYHTLNNAEGNKVTVGLWRAGGKLFWYFEPVGGASGKFVLYPGDITATQEGKLYEGVEFKSKDGDNFSGLVKEPVILEFRACAWEQGVVRCISYDESFEIQVAPNLVLKIAKAVKPESNTFEMK